MITLETTAGLANRMRAVASAVTLAEEFHTDVRVIWPMNLALNCRFDQLIEPIDHVEVRSSYSPLWKIRKKIARFQYENVFFSVTQKDNQKLLDCLSQGKDVFIQTISQFYDDGQYQAFHPTASIAARADQLTPSEGNNLVGIHIRRTDNAKSIAMSPTELFIQEIRQELQRDPETRFYLATDSREDEKEILNTFGSRIIVNRERDLRRYSNKGIQDALVDLICLSRCSSILGSYWSSFSETAAIMGKKKELHIVITC